MVGVVVVVVVVGVAVVVVVVVVVVVLYTLNTLSVVAVMVVATPLPVELGSRVGFTVKSGLGVPSRLEVSLAEGEGVVLG